MVALAVLNLIDGTNSQGARSQITPQWMSRIACLAYLIHFSLSLSLSLFLLSSVLHLARMIWWWPVLLSPILPPLADFSMLITSQASERTPFQACTTWIYCEYFFSCWWWSLFYSILSFSRSLFLPSLDSLAEWLKLHSLFLLTTSTVHFMTMPLKQSWKAHLTHLKKFRSCK